ncbi:MAG: hypothetical protein K6B14_00775 [Lachnospiraceae bacterium]|nr:hypothetical protein [Lachnospiraceae bacterium]
MDAIVKLSTREKEDLYRKKRNQYLQSSKMRSGVPKESPDSDTVESKLSGEETVAESGSLRDEPFGRKDLDDHEELIPPDYQYGIITGQYNAASVYNVADGKKELYGLYLTALLDDKIELLWMHLFDPNITTEEKGQFISFCVNADRLRRERPVKGAFVEIPDDEAWDDALDALKLAGMETCISEGHVYEFTLSQVSGTDVLQKASPRAKCVSLLEVDTAHIEQCEKLILDDARPTPFPFFVEWSRYLPDISFISIKDEKPCGAVLCTMESDHIVLEAAYSADPFALPALLWEALLIAIQIYGKDQSVLVPVVEEQSALLTQRMIPEASRYDLITGSIGF